MNVAINLLIATPAKPSWLHVSFVQSMMLTMDLLGSRGIGCAYTVEPDNPVIGMARADLEPW